MIALERVAAQLRSQAKTAAQLWRGLTGEDAYEKYLAHVQTNHSGADAATAAVDARGAVPMTEREFWRDQTDRQDRNPQGRCC